jgi:hypothetical protein
MGGRRTGKGYTRETWPATFWFHIIVYLVFTLATFARAVREFTRWNP